MDAIINFHDFWQLVPLVRESLVAAAILAVVSGILSPLVQLRDAAFAVHGTSELSFAGASVALFLGASVTGGAIAGSIVAALLMSATYTGAGHKCPYRSAATVWIGYWGAVPSALQRAFCQQIWAPDGQIVSVDENQLTVLPLWNLGLVI
ncbi:metal ABC transporter permease [Mobiluncus curtisii]|uniref:Uncharacterized protein n=1 Tax=Mobiluncus curtisii TaxID=2051 RepID=A0A2X3BNP4_9ACTO|nr:metal ABC transporter permease [Mobiluncus curtisii]SQC02333.1 Uncharacterised protein [Mobiluncus curtisii]